MLVKYEHNRMVKNKQNFEIFDQKQKTKTKQNKTKQKQKKGCFF